MQSADMKGLDIDKIDGLLGGSLASEIRRMELGRASLTKAMTQSQSLAEQMKQLVGENSGATRMAEQLKKRVTLAD